MNHSQGQLALPGVATETAAEWVWSDETGEEAEVPDFVHATVMKAEVTEALAPRAGIFVDATVGGGGHSEAILEAHPEARVIALDRDQLALDAARARLERFGDRVTFVKTPFGRVAEALDALHIEQVAGLCADLGVSSPQLDDAARGMSFRREGPIDMRMDPSEGEETALELIARLSDDQLADIIFQYGDERRSRRIARSVKRALGDNQLVTTLDLRRAIVRAVGPVRVGGVDPATRTFQALRIAVNRELEELEELIAALPRLVAPGGVTAIISFHSLEDRLVKRAFHAKDTWAPLTKKPVVAGDEEGAANPRSRSAKLRAARRLSAEEVAAGGKKYSR
ncbi:MAG TPA: 16S rRNA (cytosine(1402)-N(4))-methyltransferase RsmH [Labilithrix sp.]|nr:16S rRNA (cytosine(1402)-N(4))-methyltransferase RsmH [Labilithrix sp.]